MDGAHLSSWGKARGVSGMIRSPVASEWARVSSVGIRAFSRAANRFREAALERGTKPAMRSQLAADHRRGGRPSVVECG